MIEPGPSFSVDDVRRGIVNGLTANGVTVASFNLGDRVDFYTRAQIENAGELRHAFDYEAACTLACNGVKAEAWNFFGQYGGVVIIVSSFFIPAALYMNLRERGVHVVLWLTECPYEDERQVPMASHADTVIVNDPTHLDVFRRRNPRTFYIPHAYDPAVHHSLDRTDVHDFSFVGTGFRSRIEFFEKVDWPCVPVLGGNWPELDEDSPLTPFLLRHRLSPMDNTETAGLYRQSKTSANLYRKEAMTPDDVDGWAMGPREVELAATKTWFAREPRGEGDDLFPMLPTFTEPGELADQLRWALEHPDLRETAARAAQAAIADRTFDNHAAQLLKLIDA